MVTPQGTDGWEASYTETVPSDICSPIFFPFPSEQSSVWPSQQSDEVGVMVTGEETEVVTQAVGHVTLQRSSSRVP